MRSSFSAVFRHFGVRIAFISTALSVPVNCILPFRAIVWLGIVSWVLTVSQVAGFVGDMLHDWRPCLLCARDIPLNGGEEAERHLRSLRMVHRINKWWMLAYLGFYFVMLYLSRFTRVPLYMLPIVPSWMLIFACQRHHKLRPWCPYCRWGRGGDGPCEPSPDPVGGRQLEFPRS